MKLNTGSEVMMIQPSIRLGVALCLLSTVAVAESRKTAVTEQEFVERAAAASKTEVDLAKLALEESGNQSVRQFADKMIADHQKTNQELMTLAAKEGLTVTGVPDAESPLTEQLRAQDGAAFDRAYATRMVQEHQEAVTLFEKAANQNNMRPAIQRFANETLPTLKAHLEHAKQLHTELGADSRQAAPEQ